MEAADGVDVQPGARVQKLGVECAAEAAQEAQDLSPGALQGALQLGERM